VKLTVSVHIVQRNMYELMRHVLSDAATNRVTASVPSCNLKVIVINSLSANYLYF